MELGEEQIEPNHVVLNGEPKFRRIVIKSNGSITHSSEESIPGVYIVPIKVNIHNSNYFQIKILSHDNSDIAVGLVSDNHYLNKMPGFSADSFGYLTSKRAIYTDTVKRLEVNIDIKKDDLIGCGVKVNKPASKEKHLQPCLMKNFPAPHWAKKQYSLSRPHVYLPHHYRIFFTLNGFEVGSVGVFSYQLRNGLYPAISLSTAQTEVEFTPVCFWRPLVPAKNLQLDTWMSVDGQDEAWQKLIFVKSNGMFLEYTGRGKGYCDLGIAQAKQPLTPQNHYFDLEIVESGQLCEIIIGLTKKKFSFNCELGWANKTYSYNAADGQIFMKQQDKLFFGPKCKKGDVMGCGIRFPTSKQKSESMQIGGTTECDIGVSSKCSQTSSDKQDEHCENNFDFLYSGDETSSSLDSHEEEKNNPSSADVIRELKEIAKQISGQPVQDPLFKMTQKHERIKVEVFFTQNGIMLEKQEVELPRNGFYPTIGLNNPSEKVRVELCPLSG